MRNWFRVLEGESPHGRLARGAAVLKDHYAIVRPVGPRRGQKRTLSNPWGRGRSYTSPLTVRRPATLQLLFEPSAAIGSQDPRPSAMPERRKTRERNNSAKR